MNELKFLIDVGVGKKVEEWLQNEGYDVKCVRDIDARLSDREILKIAANENRMIITMDKDFGELVHSSGLLHAGVLLLRLEDMDSEQKRSIVERIIRGYGDIIRGKFCVFKHNKLRIKD